MLPKQFGFIGEDLPLRPWNESQHIPADSLPEALRNYLRAYDSHAVITFFETACRKNIQLYTAMSDDGRALLPTFLEDEDNPCIRIYTDADTCPECKLIPVRIRAFLRNIHAQGIEIAGVILNSEDTPFLIRWEYLKTCISSEHYNAE